MAYKNKKDQLACQRRWYNNNKEKQKDSVIKNKARIKKWFKQFKSKQKCMICNESESYCLDFHHIDEKDSDISKMVCDAYSIARIEEEISKCVILCSNCHRKIHYNILSL